MHLENFLIKYQCFDSRTTFENVLYVFVTLRVTLTLPQGMPTWKGGRTPELYRGSRTPGPQHSALREFMASLEEATMPSKAQERLPCPRPRPVSSSRKELTFSNPERNPIHLRNSLENLQTESVAGVIMERIENYKIVNGCFQDIVFTVTCGMTETAKAPAIASGTG